MSVTRQRIASLDIVRGALMVLMALDHVRDFVTGFAFDPLDVEQTTPAYYVTRWITHLVAPGFILLTGASAFLYGQRPGRTTKDVSLFLLTRGMWLIAAEMLLANIGWMGRPMPSSQSLQVIWAIGWSMVALSGLVWLPRRWLAVVGAVIVAGHNGVVMLLERASPAPGFVYAEQAGASDYLRYWLFQPGIVAFGEPGTPPWELDGILIFVYPVAAWVGVIALGYAMGPVFHGDPARRRRLLTMAAGAALGAFLLLRAINVYGDSAWAASERGPGWSILAFLNVTKYPASLQFLLITTAPILFALPRLESITTPVHGFLRTLGQVPFFFYFAHLWAARGLGHILGLMQDRTFDELTGAKFFVLTAPDPTFGQPLWVTYVATAGLVMVLLPACRWFGRVKREHPDQKWLSYL